MDDKIEIARSDRSEERGAALVTTMLCALVLLTLGLALILSTSQESTNTVNMTFETQAYYAAEAGLEAAMNVFRGNVPPATSLAGTNMNLTNAVALSTSNLSSDISTTARLSAWLSYSGNSVPIGTTGLSYSITLTDPDNTSPVRPTRLIVTSTGYGPNGSTKIMRMMVTKPTVDLSFPATVTMPGNGSGMTVNTGPSNAHAINGTDNAGVESAKPSFGITGSDISAFMGGVPRPENLLPQAGSVPEIGILSTDPTNLGAWPSSGTQQSQDVSVTAPKILANPAAAIADINAFKAIAIAQGGEAYYNPSSGVGDSTFPGTPSTPAFKFVDGDYTLGPSDYAGFLVVTGNLTTDGKTNFDGVILVIGNGSITRNGGGGGTIFGAMVIANTATASGSNFGAPTFNFNGGGNSNIQYDSSWVNKALNVFAPVVTAVSEQ